MPREIEDYVHMIGRTGRSNRKGLSTTFIHKGVSQIVLMDLKTLLIEAKQRIPEFLKVLDSKGLNLKVKYANNLVHWWTERLCLLQWIGAPY